jgi:2,4-diketo-3-deoxy-L-fuconate hydrolase
MRFLRVGAAGNETPVALIPATDRAYDLTSLTDDIDDEFLRTWHEHADAIRSGILPTIDIRDMRIGAPIARPSAVYAIGLNYANHADETKMELPGEPIVFSKAPNSICGPTDDVTLPPGSTKGDWEVELGVVIGKPTYRLAAVTDAADAIAGFVAALRASMATRTRRAMA